jgi:hypothetical protein
VGNWRLGADTKAATPPPQKTLAPVAAASADRGGGGPQRVQKPVSLVLPVPFPSPNHTSRPPHLLYVASANPALRSPKPHLPGSDLSSGAAGGGGGGDLESLGSTLPCAAGARRRCGGACDHLRRPVLPLGGGLTTGARRRLRWQTLRPPAPPTSPCSRGAPRVWTRPPTCPCVPQAAGAVVRYAPLSVLSAVLQQVGFESPGEILAWLCASDGNDDTSGAVLPPWRHCLEAIPNPRGCANSDVCPSREILARHCVGAVNGDTT